MREIQLLGQFTDAELSRRLARTKKDVWRQRRALAIPPLRPRPKFRKWRREEERLLAEVLFDLRMRFVKLSGG